jgi:hypothetical protein
MVYSYKAVPFWAFPYQVFSFIIELYSSLRDFGPYQVNRPNFLLQGFLKDAILACVET